MLVLETNMFQLGKLLFMGNIYMSISSVSSSVTEIDRIDEVFTIQLIFALKLAVL